MNVKRYLISVGALSFGLSSLGCKSEGEKKCEKLLNSSEVSLLSMSPTDEESVTSTLESIREALSACEAVKSPEVPEIKKGLKRVTTHLKRLQAGEVKAPKPPSQEELVRLEKEGDPECPAGQAYLHPLLGKKVQCRGPRMIEHSYAQVLAYFEKHHIATMVKDAMVRGTQQGVTHSFLFNNKEGKEGPICLLIEAPSDQKEVELVAFATNIAPSRLDLSKPIEIEGKSVPVSVSREGEALQVQLGDCEASEPMLPTAAPGAKEVAPAQEGEPQASSGADSATK